MPRIDHDIVTTPRLSVLYQVHVVARLVHEMVETALVDQPLSGSEFAGYSLLLVQGPATPSELALWDGTPLPTISKMLQRMDDRGHLVRGDNPNDGRSTLVALNDAGREAHTAAAEPFAAALRALHADLGDALDDILWGLARLDEGVRRTMAGPDEPADVGERRATHGLRYRGSPLTADEEAEVRSFVNWIRWKRAER